MLAGESEFIKSYTIGVEALGRSDTFDPKIDPIVRVEAGRVRRALARYYGENEASVVIELPLGTYVPVFSPPKRRGGGAALARLRRRLGGNGRLSLEIAALIAIVLVSWILIVVTRSPWHALDRAEITGSVNPPPARAPPDAAAGPIVPIIIIQPFETIRASPQQAAEVDALRSRLRDALARFDEIAVAENGELQPDKTSARSTYRLASLGEFRRNGHLSVSLWLTDADEGTIAWTRTFRGPGCRCGIGRRPDRAAGRDPARATLWGSLRERARRLRCRPPLSLRDRYVRIPARVQGRGG